MKKNIVPHQFSVTKSQRNELNGHTSLLLWFTGLSGSGKSTLANAVESALFDRGMHTYTLDGDNLRNGLNNNLAFSPEGRTENIRRIAEVSQLMMDAGLVVLAAFVSPYERDRENVKKIVGGKNFMEIYVNTPLAECEKRDVKGLYAMARRGEILDFTGVNAPYEPPKTPDIKIDTSIVSIADAVSLILAAVEKKLTI